MEQRARRARGEREARQRTPKTPPDGFAPKASLRAAVLMNAERKGQLTLTGGPRGCGNGPGATAPSDQGDAGREGLPRLSKSLTLRSILILTPGLS